jgi:hypothetical protein
MSFLLSEVRGALTQAPYETTASTPMVEEGLLMTYRSSRTRLVVSIFLARIDPPHLFISFLEGGRSYPHSEESRNQPRCCL